MHNGQLGCRKKSSDIFTAAIIVDRAHSEWNDDKLTGVLLIDMKTACPSLARGRLIHAIKAKWIYGDHIRRTESILPDSTADMVIEGNILQTHHVEAGVPHCSPVSPILFAIHTAGLIQSVEE